MLCSRRVSWRCSCAALLKLTRQRMQLLQLPPSSPLPRLLSVRLEQQGTLTRRTRFLTSLCSPRLSATTVVAAPVRVLAAVA